MAAGSIPNGTNGIASAMMNGTNGNTSSVSPRRVNKPHHAGSPYQSVGDFLSNTDKFQIIESTLREGEQFANAFFDTETKIKIATALSDFGVEYIELTSPAASEQSRKDCEAICKLGLKSKILTHVRCTVSSNIGSRHDIN
ncbi:Saccharopine dehydrogenase [Claviceps pusilla]|uniref:Saccharopine dehydrogenase n=1 Tax=Claviceps pusilla TaxID=123648 RepID=A0A9P7N9P9_9HYPO|nr:Saccharopine dehydrogenase [Claviceps pusilla]